jgi:hypothetical protein
MANDARVVELADTPALGAGGRKPLGVRVPPRALEERRVEGYSLEAAVMRSSFSWELVGERKSGGCRYSKRSS